MNEENESLTEIEIGMDVNSIDIMFIESLSRCGFVFVLLVFLFLELGCVALGLRAPGHGGHTISKEYNIDASSPTVPSIFSFSANNIYGPVEIQLIATRNNYTVSRLELNFNATLYLTRNNVLQPKELPTETKVISFRSGARNSLPLTLSYPNFDIYRASTASFSFKSDTRQIQKLQFECIFNDAKFSMYISRVNKGLFYASLYCLFCYWFLVYGNVIEITQTLNVPLLILCVLSVTPSRIATFTSVLLEFSIKLRMSREMSRRRTFYDAIFLVVQMLCEHSGNPSIRMASDALYVLFIVIVVIVSRSARPQPRRYLAFALFAITSAVTSVVKCHSRFGEEDARNLIYKTSFWTIGLFMSLCQVTVSSDTGVPVEFHAL